MNKAHGKKYLEADKLIDHEKLYQPQEAVTLLKKLNYVKFDPTVEVHMKLGVTHVTLTRWCAVSLCCPLAPVKR